MPMYNESLVIGKDGRYSRSSSAHHEDLRHALMKGYDCTQCVIASSGMNAISTMINSILAVRGYSTPVNIVYSQELYCDTPRLFQYISSLHPSVKLTTIDVTKSDDIVDLFSNQLNGQDSILFFESCSNPNGYIFDWSIIPELRRASNQLYVIADNTWLTEVVFNPLKHGADYVVFSTTKYYSAGTAIGGAIVGSDEKMFQAVFDWSRFNGQHASPHNCKLTAQNYKTMVQRIHSSSQLTLKIAQFATEKFTQVNYPLLPDHPSYKLALKYFTQNGENNAVLGPSVFTFKVKASKSKVLKAMKMNKSIEHKTSFGSEKSRTDPWPERDGDWMVCRLAIGFADAEDSVKKGLNEFAVAVSK